MPPLRYFMFPHGSSPACGRPHGAAPTVNLETVPLFRRGRTLAGPQIYAARPGGRALQPCTSRHLLGKARRESGTAPAAIFADPGPSGPEGGGGRLIAAPTAIPTRLRWFGNPGAEAEPHQPQFLQTQGPVARRESRKATQILRAGRALPTQRVHPRKRGPGKGEYGHEVSILSRPRWRFGEFLPYLPAKPSAAGSPGRGGARERAQFSPSGGNGDKRTLRRRAAMGKVTRRPQAAKLPANNGTHSETCPLIRPLRGHLPPGGKAFQEDLCKHTHYQRVR